VNLRCAELMRHGQTEVSGFFGSTETALTDLGRAQLWQAVADRRWDSIFTSPLRRCADFAEALAAHLGVVSCADPRLAEMHFGAWEGHTAEQLMSTDAERLGRFWQNPVRYPPPGAEPLAALGTRVLSFWRDLIRRDDIVQPLVLTHGGPIRILLAQQRGVSLDQLLRIDVPHATCYTLPLTMSADEIPCGGASSDPPCGHC
jgi:alpha-ribazole phosphatase